jgi:hypothetical protein
VSPHIADAAANTMTPSVTILRWPTVSARRPPNANSAASDSRYALTAHCTPVLVRPSSRWIFGHRDRDDRLVDERHRDREDHRREDQVARWASAMATTCCACSWAGQSLLMLEPPEHLTRRKMLLPPFHGERVQSYARLMERLTAAELERLRPGTLVKIKPIAPSADAGRDLAGGARRRGPRGARAAATDLRRAEHAAEQLRAVRAAAGAPRALEPALESRLALERRARRGAVRAHRGNSGGPAAERARGHPGDAGGRARRGRRGTERRAAARRTDHADRGRPRDDGDGDGVGRRTAGPQPDGDVSRAGRETIFIWRHW